jgi:hypothetical protein
MNFPGYEITEKCDNLIVYNKEKALSYAFTAGLNSAPSDVFWYLFNGCLKIDPLTPHSAYYFFDLLLWAYSSYLYQGKITYSELHNFILPFAKVCGRVNPEIKMITQPQVLLIIQQETNK